MIHNVDIFFSRPGDGRHLYVQTGDENSRYLKLRLWQWTGDIPEQIDTTGYLAAMVYSYNSGANQTDEINAELQEDGTFVTLIPIDPLLQIGEVEAQLKLRITGESQVIQSAVLKIDVLKSLTPNAAYTEQAVTQLTAVLALLEGDFAPLIHSHGNIDNDGKIGSTADLPLFTGADGLIAAISAASARTKLGLGDAALKTVGTAEGNLVELLAGGKLPTSVLPPLAIGENKGTVTNQTDLTTLTTAESSDIAEVTGDADAAKNGIYMLFGDYSVLANWKQLTPPGAVFSVNSQTGAVVLVASDLGIVDAGGYFAGATVEAALQETGLALGGRVQMDLLWENASPASSFAAQSLSLDSTGYTHLLCQAVLMTAVQKPIVPVIIKKGGLSALWSACTSQNNFRTITSASDSAVVFEGGYAVATYASASADDTRIIPYRIFGLKYLGDET